ncbi:hypothetical protein [Arthrobacter sp. 9MFCol3.1]|uniref:hypothetical protein n=1 Tax=Arthrobacter sp. 9MFCol3.1 TaxID=1150398 RepID=UPI0012DE33A7|nr:hypothetical protein [Arthrobacter sp. 9MFCol3.1]
MRRRPAAFPALVFLSVLALAATGCGGPQGPTAPAAERTVGVGYETVVDAASTLPELARRLDEVHANSVTISVGRLDWTAFPWDAHPGIEAVPGRDHVAEAVKALGTGGDGRKRRITLTIDLLIPGWISTNPGLAGINFDGTRSRDFASVTALTTGPVGERLVDFVAEVTRRYQPDAVALTELMFDNNTYGGDDRDSYMLASGGTDWPRLANGDVDVGHPSLGAWRSKAVAAVVARAAAAAHANGATLDMDVRAPWHDPAGDRPESGHDYGLLAAAADRLVLWDYFGLNDAAPSYSAELAAAMAKRSGKFAISVGMWAKEGRISAADLAVGLEAAVSGGAAAVAVTPSSMLDDDAWRALKAAWA